MVPNGLNHLVLCVLTATVLGGSASAADIVVKTRPPANWTSGNQASEPSAPLILQVQKGDIIKFTLNTRHGLVTLDESGAPKADLVITCAQTPSKDTEDKAVLKEVDCHGTSTIFNPPHLHPVAGEIHLEVKPNFQNDVRFWCTEHLGAMQGIIRLKSQMMRPSP